MSPTALAEPRRTRPEPPPDLHADAEPLDAEPSLDGLWCSEQDYWTHYYLLSDTHYEWNNGRLEEKPVSDFETFQVYHWFMQLLDHYLRARPVGKLVALEMGFRLRLPTGVVIRKPDFGVVLDDNPQPILPHDASYHGVFDLCVEALSDTKRSHIERDTLIKKAEYAAGGVPEYYILHSEPEHQAFFARTASGLYAPIAPIEGVIDSRVLPGFRFRPADLCRQPPHEDLRTDPVYADFVLPAMQEAERRAAAEAEARRAAEARAAAETEARLAAEARAAVEEVARQAAEARADAEAQRAAAEAEARRAAEARALAAEQALARLQGDDPLLIDG